MQATTDWSKGLRVEVRGDDVVGHAGNVTPRMLADATGLTSGVSAVLSRPEVLHDRGAVMPDVAVSIAGGAQNLAGTAVLRDQGGRFGQVASVPTMWRSLNEVDDAALRNPRDMAKAGLPVPRSPEDETEPQPLQKGPPQSGPPRTSKAARPRRRWLRRAMRAP
jgi:hypothetical protein